MDNILIEDSLKVRMYNMELKLSEIRAACYDMLKELKELKKNAKMP
jgi:hypothetical protein